MPQQRIKNCRAYADQTRVEAAKIHDPQLRDRYEKIARMWERLANVIEKTSVTTSSKSPTKN